VESRTQDIVPPQTSGAQQPEAEVEALRPSDKLKLAVRRARLDDAERTKVVAELRGAEIARLEMLRDEILPVAAEIPKDIDLFDIGLVATEQPRLFIDMIGFIEMGHDRRTYRFIQDTRHGRVVIAESERVQPIVDAVTDYIARRLIEREKALAGDGTLEQAARAYAEAQEKIAARHQALAAAHGTPKTPGPFSRAFSFLIEILGSVLLFALLALGAYTAWKYLAALPLRRG
jgi:hypothetical protein